MSALARPARFDKGAQHRRGLIAKVHIAKTQLGLVDDDYRAVLLDVAGQDSAAKCSDDDLVKILKRFEQRGFTAKARSGAPKPADHPTARKARALWISLHQLGAVKSPSEQSLEAFARRQLKVERLQWANQGLAYRLIEALKAMAERAGWSQDLAGVSANNTVRVLKIRLVDRLLVLLKADRLVPADWSVETAAYRLGGVIVGPLAGTWSLAEIDTVSALFAAKRRNPAGMPGDVA